MQDDAGPDDEAVRSFRATKRRGLGRGLLAAAAVIAFTLAMQAHGRVMRSYVRGERTLEGDPRYTPDHDVDPAHLEEIDFERVHGQLVPAWTIALAHATSPYWARRADDRFDELAREVAPDPNLAELLARTHRDLREAPMERADRLDYRLWAYNEYLDRHHVPWRLEAALILGAERPVFHTFSYRVVADARSAGHRVRLLRRQDRTSSLEGWMGKTGRGDEGAMVLMRRVLHFAVRHVWVGMHAGLDARRPPEERSWLPPMRAEVAAQLPPEAVRLLEETAVDQQALVEIADAVAARRRECRGRYSLDRSLPYNGLSRAGVRALYLALARSRTRPDCPEVTVDEAARLIGASERLASTDGLEDAIERLAMVVARAVAVHELRHVADGEALACPGCPEGLDGLAREEVSAYLAAFADPDTGYLSLLQACSAPASDTVHGQARTRTLEAILPLGCAGPPHPMMKAYARMLEEELFDTRDHVPAPDLPERVQLLPRAAQARLDR